MAPPAVPAPVEHPKVDPTPFAPPRVDVYQPTPPAVAPAVAPAVSPPAPPAPPAAPVATPPERAPRPTWSASDRPEFAPVVPTPTAPEVPHFGAGEAASPEPDGQRRSINPFLTRDPALRAKRLARALVSDIVAYHPARHAEGLRDGTLKTLFRDEIKKSYEEYVDQVGRDFAGSTTHFQDALNDVLASGKKLF
ncbi:MAG: hypothetical protein ABI311_03965 [Gemmatimonadaceae bacterium]